MDTKDITTKELNKYLEKASQKALRENSALGLSYKTIENGELVEKHPDGTIVREAQISNRYREEENI